MWYAYFESLTLKTNPAYAIHEIGERCRYLLDSAGTFATGGGHICRSLGDVFIDSPITESI